MNPCRPTGVRAALTNENASRDCEEQMHRVVVCGVGAVARCGGDESGGT